jgi:UDP-glucose 4-epimerase
MIIIFGAAGFIGTYLVEHLTGEGYSVLSADVSEIGEEYFKKQGLPYMHLDVTQKDAFKRLPGEGVEAVIHLACVQPANVSEELYDPADYIKVNIIGTLHILEYCRSAAVKKIIYASSHRNTQGLWEQGKAIREEDGRALKYTGQYAMFSISESAAQDCVEHYRQQYGIQGITFRLPPVYGYGPHTEIFWQGKPIKTGFQIFVENAVASKTIELWGDCEKGRDIIYVKDVVSAFSMALKSENAAGLYNITSGRSISLREEAETIVKVFSGENGKPEIRREPGKPNSIEPFVYDNGKAKRDFGWVPQYSFEDMLIDYKREKEAGRFSFLLEKRRRLKGEKRKENP